MELNEKQNLANGDPWSMNKLQATHFLHASKQICSEAMHANAAGEIASEDGMDLFCIKRLVETIMTKAMENKIITVAPSSEQIEQVHLNWCTTYN